MKFHEDSYSDNDMFLYSLVAGDLSHDAWSVSFFFVVVNNWFEMPNEYCKWYNFWYSFVYFTQ